MHRDEAGASLVIALIFVVVMSLVIIAIVDLSGTNLINTANLEQDRAVTYAADGTVDTAIQIERYNPGQVCNSSLHVPSIQSSLGVGVTVYCQSGGPTGFRQATFEACASGSNFSACDAAKAYEIRAVVQYSDSPTTGSTVSIQSWTVNSANG